MTRKGIIFILSSPSGAGKTTILRQVKAEIEELEDSVSYTTRPMRPGERDGIDYHFLTADEFLARVESGFFAEWAQVYDRYYGTGRPDLEAIIQRGHDVIMDIDIQGAQQMHERFPGAVRVFILPPSLTELERRLLARKSDSETEIGKRLESAAGEVAAFTAYDYVIVNHDVHEAVQAMSDIIHVERRRVSRLNGAELLAEIIAGPAEGQAELPL